MSKRQVNSVLFAIVVCTGLSWAQTVDSAQADEGIVRKMFTGGVKCLAWHDIPIAAADAAQMLFVPANATGKPIRFPATQFDLDFQERVGVHGSRTIIGQIGEVETGAFLGVRLLVNIGSDLLGGHVTAGDYHRTFWFYKSIIYTISLTSLTKNLVYRLRPDGSDSQSFFSGHSSTAFCVASYLSLELNDWYDRWEPTRTDPALRSALKIGSDVGLIAGATYVAYARMHDEKHYLSDVVVGAGVGTLVGTLMYRGHWSSGGPTPPNISFLIIHRIPTLFYTAQF